MQPTARQRVMKKYPKAFSYFVAPAIGYAVADKNFGGIIGYGTSRAKAWADAAKKVSRRK